MKHRNVSRETPQKEGGFEDERTKTVTGGRGALSTLFKVRSRAYIAKATPHLLKCAENTAFLSTAVD